MAKKKTPTPVKKAAPKKKPLISKNIQAVEVKWASDFKFEVPPYVEAHFKKYDDVVPDARALGAIAPPAGETRISELEAENHALKTLLSKHQSEPMPQGKPIQEKRITMLSQFTEQLDGQLSRLYNSLNTLDATSNRLVSDKEGTIQGNASEPHDLSTRLSNLIGYFSQQNDRLDMLNAKLSDLI